MFVKHLLCAKYPIRKWSKLLTYMGDELSPMNQREKNSNLMSTVDLSNYSQTFLNNELSIVLNISSFSKELSVKFYV